MKLEQGSSASGLGVGWVVGALAALLAAPAAAQAPSPGDEASCDVAAPMSPTRLLRRLSIDLRGRAPGFAELEATQSAGEVPAGTIASWLASEELLSVMREHHEELLWPNLDQVELVGQINMIYPFPRGDDVIYVSPLRSAFFRAAGNGSLYEPCANEPARFDADGRLILEPRLIGTTTVAWVDGYVEARPYWDPSIKIKVCALEAIESEQAPACPEEPGKYPLLEPTCRNIQRTAQQFQIAFRGADVDCEGPLSTFAPGCGCGSDLRRCQTPQTLARLRASLNEQALRVVERVLREDRPYHEILTDPVVEVSGPIAHYLRHQARLTLDLFADPDPTAPMGSVDLPFTSDAWTPITRTGRHAGVLTTPAYLLRHAAWRQRAHRFYNAFECSSFVPSGPLPSPFAECSQHEDLTQRCGCDGCHRSLEPMAAHWSRFAEYGFMSLDETQFPTIGLRTCAPPFKSIEQLFNCTRLYELDPVGDELPYRGYLNGYVFRTPAEQQNIAEGPRKLVQDSLDSGRFAACAVERMWTRFMHRAPNPDELAEVLPDLARDFIDGNYDLRELVRSIVEQPAYGRAP